MGIIDPTKKQIFYAEMMRVLLIGAVIAAGVKRQELLSEIVAVGAAILPSLYLWKEKVGKAFYSHGSSFVMAVPLVAYFYLPKNPHGEIIVALLALMIIYSLCLLFSLVRIAAMALQKKDGLGVNEG